MVKHWEDIRQQSKLTDEQRAATDEKVRAEARAQSLIDEWLKTVDGLYTKEERASLVAMLVGYGDQRVKVERDAIKGLMPAILNGGCPQCVETRHAIEALDKRSGK